jgi:hypothetical protein
MTGQGLLPSATSMSHPSHITPVSVNRVAVEDSATSTDETQSPACHACVKHVDKACALRHIRETLVADVIPYTYLRHLLRTLQQLDEYRLGLPRRREAALVGSHSLAVWRNYLRFHVIDRYARCSEQRLYLEPSARVRIW